MMGDDDDDDDETDMDAPMTGGVAGGRHGASGIDSLRLSNKKVGKAGMRGNTSSDDDDEEEEEEEAEDAMSGCDDDDDDSSSSSSDSDSEDANALRKLRTATEKFYSDLQIYTNDTVF